MKDELIIGRVRSSFGVAGEIKVESFSGEMSHFDKLRVVNLRHHNRMESYTVESVRHTHRAVLIKLEGVDNPEDAAKLRGREIVADRKDAVPLEPGEYYYADLHGLEVIVDGDPIGKVTAIWEAGPYPLIEVTHQAERKALVPFVARFFGDVDLEGGRIQLIDPAVLE